MASNYTQEKILTLLETQPDLRKSKIFFGRDIKSQQDYEDYLKFEEDICRNVFTFANPDCFDWFYRQFNTNKDTYEMTSRR